MRAGSNSSPLRRPARAANGTGAKGSAEGRVTDLSEVRGFAQHRGDRADRVDRRGLALVVRRRDRGVALDVLDRAHPRIHRPLDVGDGLIALEVDEMRGQSRVLVLRRGDQPQRAGRGAGHRRGGRNVEFDGETGAVGCGIAGFSAPCLKGRFERIVAVDRSCRGLVRHGGRRDEGGDVGSPVDRALALAVEVDDR